MRLLRVRLRQVRGIDACEVHFVRDGVTVVEAPNEAGKTTLMDAVDVLLEMKDSSNAQRVKELQPVTAEVGSTIEVELISGATHLTCTKTFNKQRSTLLTIHAPTPEQVRGTDAHDRLRGILEAEVDLDLAAALRFEQGRGLEAVSLQKSQVLAARLDAVAGGSGGGDGDVLLDRVAAEFARYFTPTGAERKTLTDLDRIVEQLEQTQLDTRRRLAEVAEQVDELVLIESELPALQRRLDQEIIPRAAELDRQLASIRSCSETVDARTAERDRAQADLDAARRDADERQDLLRDLTSSQEAVASIEQVLGPLRDRQVALRADLDAREHDLTSATESARAAQRERDLAQLQVDLVQARQHHRHLLGRHDRAGRLRAQARTAAAALDELTLDEDGLSEIRSAERAKELAAATLAAGAPTISVRAQQSLAFAADGRDISVEHDGRWDGPVARRFHLDIPGVVEIDVRPGGTTADLQRALTEAGDRVTDLCAAAGVADLAEAERVVAARREHEATLRRHDTALARELDGLTVTELDAELDDATRRVDQLCARLPEGAAEAADLGAARDRLDRARPAAEAADEQVGGRRAARDAVAEELTAVRMQAATEEANLVQQQEQRRRRQEDLAAGRSSRSDEELTERVASVRTALTQATERLDAAAAQLADLDPEAVQLDARNWEQQRADAQERLRTLGERRAALRARLEVAGDEGLGERAQDVEQRLARAAAERRRVRARAAAARSLHDALTTARAEAYRAYRTPLRDRIVDQARLLYRRDVAITLGDDLAILTRTLDGATLAWDQLSAGAREQLSILTGLAAAQLAGDDGVPFVLDDALGYTDPRRLERLGALLGRTRDAQVIVLTCVAERFRHVGGANVVRLRETRDDEHDG